METAVKERLIEFIKAKDISIREFERACGLSNGYLKSLRRSPKSEKIADILSAFPDLNRVWLLTGEGSMLTNPEPGTSPPHNAAIPFFDDIQFGCSPGGFTGAVEIKKAQAQIIVPGLSADGSTFVVRARGDSMVNAANPERSIPNGALVAIRKSYISTPRWGETYALSTADGCIIKRIYPSDREDYIRCVSFNSEEFPPFELHKSEIYDIGNVVAVINLTHWS